MDEGALQLASQILQAAMGKTGNQSQWLTAQKVVRMSHRKRRSPAEQGRDCPYRSGTGNRSWEVSLPTALSAEPLCSQLYSPDPSFLLLSKNSHVGHFAHIFNHILSYQPCSWALMIFHFYTTFSGLDLALASQAVWKAAHLWFIYFSAFFR